jgi:hypothetical protein
MLLRENANWIVESKHEASIASPEIILTTRTVKYTWTGYNRNQEHFLKNVGTELILDMNELMQSKYRGLLCISACLALQQSYNTNEV